MISDARDKQEDKMTKQEMLDKIMAETLKSIGSGVNTQLVAESLDRGLLPGDVITYTPGADGLSRRVKVLDGRNVEITHGDNVRTMACPADAWDNMLMLKASRDGATGTHMGRI